MLKKQLSTAKIIYWTNLSLFLNDIYKFRLKLAKYFYLTKYLRFIINKVKLNKNYINYIKKCPIYHLVVENKNLQGESRFLVQKLHFTCFLIKKLKIK